MKAVHVIAALILLAFPINVASHWGTRWTVGRYWMLKPLLVEGRFADGSPADAVTLMIADGHEEVVLGIACVVGAALTYLLRVNRRNAREDAAVAEVLKDVPAWWLAENGIRKVNGRYLKEQRDD